MAIVDASALIAAFANEPGRELVEELFAERAATASAVNIIEVYDALIRSHGASRETVDSRFDVLEHAEALVVIPLTREIAVRAGELRAKHYHRTRQPVSLADCAALATAESLGESLATTDQGLAEMAREESIEVIALQDSSGRRP